MRETGEGTARLLHSIANGEVDTREGKTAKAQRALDDMARTPRKSISWKETAETLVSTSPELSGSLTKAVLRAVQNAASRPQAFAAGFAQRL